MRQQLRWRLKISLLPKPDLRRCANRIAQIRAAAPFSATYYAISKELVCFKTCCPRCCSR